MIDLISTSIVLIGLVIIYSFIVFQFGKRVGRSEEQSKQFAERNNKHE